MKMGNLVLEYKFYNWFHFGFEKIKNIIKQLIFMIRF